MKKNNDFYQIKNEEKEFTNLAERMGLKNKQKEEFAKIWNQQYTELTKGKEILQTLFWWLLDKMPIWRVIMYFKTKSTEELQELLLTV